MQTSLLLQAKNTTSGATIERRFDRGPIGRDDRAVAFPLAGDPSVSKLHATIDVRDGRVLARDVRSTNGTFANGERLASNRWRDLGPSSDAPRIDVGAWRIVVRVVDAPPRCPPAPPVIAVKSTTVLMKPARVGVVREPPLVGASNSGALERAALAALREIARRYVDAPNPLATVDEIAAFQSKITSAVDELCAGYAPLVVGQSRLEEQFVPGHRDRLTPERPQRTPGDLARKLLDWRDPSDAPAVSVRRGFVELMAHQAAWISGTMRGIQALLQELSPALMEREHAERTSTSPFLRWVDRAVRWIYSALGSPTLFDIYRERFSDLADEEKERFRVIFGPEFAAEYKQLAREASAKIPTRP